jgi:hypothetical protein
MLVPNRAEHTSSPSEKNSHPSEAVTLTSRGEAMMNASAKQRSWAGVASNRNRLRDHTSTIWIVCFGSDRAFCRCLHMVLTNSSCPGFLRQAMHEDETGGSGRLSLGTRGGRSGHSSRVLLGVPCEALFARCRRSAAILLGGVFIFCFKISPRSP